MAKQSGLGDNLYVGGYDLSGDINSVRRAGGGPSPIITTGIDKLGYERIGGRRDGGIEWVSYFNPATDRAHPVQSRLPTTDTHAMYCRGTVLGSPAASLVARQADYNGTRGDGGEFTFAVSMLGDGFGLEWGRLLTAGPRTDTAATNGTGVDFSAAHAFGLQAYLQVFSFTGTDATIRIQESSDNGAGDAFANVTGGAFTQVTGARVFERIATAAGQSVERYLRVITSTSAGFTSLSFAVMVVVNETAVSF